MARVICSLPHAAAIISGVKFVMDRGEAISEEIEDEVAAIFTRIPGFRPVEVAANGKKSGGKSPETPKADPKTDAPTVDAPKADAPKPEAPKPEAPADTPK